MLRNLSPRAKAAIWAGVSAVSLFILLAALSGLIGNGTYALTPWLLNQMLRFIRVSSPLWVVVFPSWVLLLAVIAVLLVGWINSKRRVRRLSNAINHLNNLDDTLVNCAPQLLFPKKSGYGLEDEVRSIVKRLLKQATEAFPRDVHRAVFFRPEGKYLKLWEECGGIDTDSRKRKKFYIGEEQRPGMKRGVAGEAFYKRSVIVVHIQDYKGSWKSDNEEVYICFDERVEAGRSIYPQPPYSSLACVPLIIRKGASECLGVVCFDSNDEKVFDPRGANDLLILLAARLRAIMVIYQEVEKFFLKQQAQGGDSAGVS